MINIAICDDEPGTCTDLENMILSYAKSHALQINTEVFFSGESFHRAIDEKTPFDLVFLDILLLEMDGVQVGRNIREQLGNEKISIVYISSKEAYAMSLFQVRPLDFLIKPITYENISDIITKFIRIHERNKKEFLFQVQKTVCKLYLDEIRYFACNGKKIEIYTDRNAREFYGNMQEVWKQVEGRGFWVIHKSYIVNSAYVSVYRYDSVELSTGETLPISQKYRKSMKDNLTRLLRGDTDAMD